MNDGLGERKRLKIDAMWEQATVSGCEKVGRQDGERRMSQKGCTLWLTTVLGHYQAEDRWFIMFPGHSLWLSLRNSSFSLCKLFKRKSFHRSAGIPYIVCLCMEFIRLLLSFCG